MGSAAPSGANPPPGQPMPDSENPEKGLRGRILSHQAKGVSAIPVTAAAHPGRAAFSIADVRAYLAAHPPRLAAATPTIEVIEFVPAREAQDRTQCQAGGRTPDELVCLVTLHGDFVARSAPHGFARPRGHGSHLIFDARTGNLLVETIEP